MLEIYAYKVCVRVTNGAKSKVWCFLFKKQEKEDDARKFTSIMVQLFVIA